MKCRNCGQKNRWQAQFCSGCGSALEPAPSPPPAAAETGPESWRWVVLWTLAALAIVIVLCFYAFKPEGKFEHSRIPNTAQVMPGRTAP